MMRVLVTGATSLIGWYLLPRLERLGDVRVTAISRRPRLPEGAGFSSAFWVQQDIASAIDTHLLDTHDVLLHLAPLWTLPGWLECGPAGDIRRVIAFSSTSVFTKTESTNARERSVAAALASAETSLSRWSTEHSVEWTIFRPTLVYGGGRDKNISAIARFIRRFHVFPVIGAGKGLRMPVHADDLAQACVQAIAAPATFRRAYDLPGGETLSYRMMIERIFAGLGLRPHILTVPRALMRTGIQLARHLPGKREWTPEMADRMAVDLVFDGSAARTDFQFDPRRFHPGVEDLLGK